VLPENVMMLRSLMALIVIASGAVPLMAQVGEGSPRAGASQGQVLFISPVAAPAGASVRLFATGFRPGELVQFGSGASADTAQRVGAEARANRFGVAEGRIVVPAALPASGEWYFIASSRARGVATSPVRFLALSGRPDGEVESPPLPSIPSPGEEEGAPMRVDVTGLLTGEGVECPAMRGDDGRLYTLTGNLQGNRQGDRVRVVGTVAEISFCMQGTTVVIEQISRVE
jgi:hypothetical protein